MQGSLKDFKAKFNKIDLVIPLVLGILVILSRLPFISKYLYEWDSVNYALAFQNYNLLQEQPHAPGYILYVALGRAFNYIFHDPNTTMIFLAVLFTIFSSILIYFMAKDIFSRKVAVISSLLFVFNPLIWFYGEIASIYIFESFWAILIAYSSYKVLQGNEKFIYISAFFLGIAGGFRIEIVEFMIPLWLYCVYCAKPSFSKVIKGLLVFVISFMLWFLPTTILAGGFSQYMVLLGSQSAAAGHTSILFGASIKQQIMNSGAFLAWSFLGVTLVGFVIGLWFIIICLKKQLKGQNGGLKSSIIAVLKNKKVMFFVIWILPAFLFYLIIYVMKPGYILNFIPAVIIVLGYAVISIADALSLKFPKFSKNQLAACLLILCILTNVVYFVFPFNLHEGGFWETQTDHMTTAQEINYLVDVGLVYSNAKITANDQNTRYNIQAILNISQSNPNSTLIVIRDITREDEGFNWRKAMYYLSEYNVYYLFDEENAGLDNQVSSWHGYEGKYNISFSSSLNIPVNPSVTRIIWIMDDESDFYKEVETKMGVNTINLANGLKVYYSDVGNDSWDIQISGFIFKK
jgi:hypothetical protein